LQPSSALVVSGLSGDRHREQVCVNENHR
jgi:hypothetical protein